MTRRPTVHRATWQNDRWTIGAKVRRPWWRYIRRGVAMLIVGSVGAVVVVQMLADLPGL